MAWHRGADTSTPNQRIIIRYQQLAASVACRHIMKAIQQSSAASSGGDDGRGLRRRRRYFAHRHRRNAVAMSPGRRQNIMNGSRENTEMMAKRHALPPKL